MTALKTVGSRRADARFGRLRDRQCLPTVTARFLVPPVRLIFDRANQRRRRMPLHEQGPWPRSGRFQPTEKVPSIECPIGVPARDQRGRTRPEHGG
jgi:hypothetical protein